MNSDKAAQDKPRVSIGLPVYNGDRYLEEALDSLLSQTFKDFELIISDNASTDRTPEICLKHASRDGRIRYHRVEQNQGASWNFNRVLDLARADYFKWAAHDDLCHPQFLERCVAVLDQQPGVVLAHSRSILIDENGKHLQPYDNRCHPAHGRPSERFLEVLTRLGLCHTMFGVIRTAVLRRTACIDTYQASDMIMLGELALRGEFYEVPEHLFYRRVHPEMSAQANPSESSLAVWYSPKNLGKLQLLHWTWLFKYLRAIGRVPMGFAEKLRCYFLMARWFRWQIPFLRRELAAGLSRLFFLK